MSVEATYSNLTKKEGAEMTMSFGAKCALILGVVNVLGACQSDPIYVGPEAYQHGVVYRGGERVIPGPLALNDNYEFIFLDKWRISHAWFSGPADIAYCEYSRRDSGRGVDRFIEIDGVLKAERISGAAENFGKKYISSQQENIYGTNPRTGKFEGYSTYCNHVFVDIWTGVSVSLIKPDPLHGTDAYIANARRVSINNLSWLMQSAPVRNSEEVRREGGAIIERWILEIPKSSYWMMITLGGSRSSDGKGLGIDRDPEKFSRVLNLVHDMVKSVRIEPIDTPARSLSAPKQPGMLGGSVKG